MASEKIVNLDSSTFADLDSSETPVMVDFWAPWCGPCLAVAPVLEELANELEGKVRIAKVNIDENPEIASQFQVSSIPTFVILKDGEVADRTMGALPKAAFQQFLSNHV